MSTFLKAVAIALTGLVLWLCLNKYNKDMSLLLTLAVCVALLMVALAILKPVLDFFEKLQDLGGLDEGLLQVVLKTVGIGLLGEMSANLCKDAGNASLGKALQISATVTILWLSIPVFEKMLSLLENILGAV